jgi:uncharacterized membrane protein YphA (DoxX/SURF4 family)
MIKYLKENADYSIDLRALGLARIHLALAILVSTIFYMTAIPAYFTPEGIFGQELSNLGNSRFSLLYASYHTPFITYLIFAANIILSFLYLIGYKTRIVGILLFIVTTSIEVFTQDSEISNAANQYCHFILFWMLFLPVDKRYSLFSEPSDDKKISGVPVFALRVQIALVYFIAGMAKYGDSWIKDFSAVKRTLLSDYGSDVGNWLGHHLPDGVLKAMTIFTLVFEYGMPILLFSPFKRKFCDNLAALSIFLFHFALSVMARLDFFVLVFSINCSLLMKGNILDFTDQIAKYLKEAQLKIRKHFLLLMNKFNILIFSNRTKNLFLLFMVVITIQSNLRVAKDYPFQSSDMVIGVQKLIGFDQGWGMFGPDAPYVMSWIALQGEFEDGVLYDLLNSNKNGDPVRPKNIDKYYNDRLMRLAVPIIIRVARGKNSIEQRSKIATNYARFYCRKINDLRTNNLLRTLFIYGVDEAVIKGRDKKLNDPISELVLKYDCLNFRRLEIEK